MTKKTSIKNIEIILSIRELQKMISETETPEVINVLISRPIENSVSNNISFFYCLRIYK